MNLYREEPEVPFSPSDLKAQKGQPIAFNGVCLVTLVTQGKVVYGKPLYWWNHEGRTYYFAHTGAIVSFMNNPSRYVPYNDGYCVVTEAQTGQKVTGDPRYAQAYQGHLYLFAGPEELAAFNKTLVSSAETDNAEVETLPVQTVAAKAAPSGGKSASARKTQLVSRVETSSRSPEREGRISGLFRRVFKK